MTSSKDKNKITKRKKEERAIELLLNTMHTTLRNDMKKFSATVLLLCSPR